MGRQVKYLILNLAFLLMLAATLFIVTRSKISKPIIYTLIFLLALTVIFDSLIILNEIVGYNKDNILGIYIWRAPIEDFAYAIASVLTVSLLWEYYDSKK